MAGYYALDVQYEYESLKKNYLLAVNGIAINKIVNSKPDNNTWYHISDKPTRLYISLENNKKGRRMTKLKLAVKLSWERIVYFWIPWLVLSFLLAKEICSKNCILKKLFIIAIIVLPYLNAQITLKATYQILPVFHLPK